ncbi:MAG: cation transporter [Archaeoglobi archaeon]|jgi:cation diffusion facilitator family transporter|nr:MAG: cation transporter [Archaeoglobi archaeon]TDA29177.1 MAG: cation transporter [Archaeoglobi archaeon]
MKLNFVLAVYIATLLVKIFAYLLSGLLVILADVMHSLADIVLLLILIAASHVSKKDADERHPFGHGLIKNLASLVVSVAFITLISFELAKEGIERILNPANYENVETALFAELLVLILLLLALPVLRKEGGILNRTALMETVNDSLSTLAAIVGITAVMAGYKAFDGISAIFVAILIAFNSFRLFKENATFLLGLSPPSEFYSKIEKSVIEVRGVEGVHNLLAVYTAENEIHLDLHVTIDGRMRVEDAEKISGEIARKLRSEFPEIKHVSIHFCPYLKKGELQK